MQQWISVLLIGLLCNCFSDGCGLHLISRSPEVIWYQGQGLVAGQAIGWHGLWGVSLGTESREWDSFLAGGILTYLSGWYVLCLNRECLLGLSTGPGSGTGNELGRHGLLDASL